MRTILPQYEWIGAGSVSPRMMFRLSLNFYSLMRAFSYACLLSVCLWATPLHAQHEEHRKLESDDQGREAPNDQASPPNQHSGTRSLRLPMTPNDCLVDEVWDIEVGMCMPLPMRNMRMTHLMLHGNAFLVGLTESSPRGRSVITSPNMFMANLGRSVADEHFINLGLMLTVEKWTFPQKGYPELLQIGERDEDENPYVDAQHPHTSPIMGLTLSDTIRWGVSQDHLKLFFSPRGQTTDGPIAFMHRSAGMANPDAPLGHHIGQDVGHISSTVIGSSIKLHDNRFELSVFNGTEPEPAKIDLPFGVPNSVGVRYVREFSSSLMAMTSIAYIKDPELHEPKTDHRWRLSASAMSQLSLGGEWTWYNSAIFGAVTDYDQATLFSFGEEFWFRRDRFNIWGRVELLQRTPAQLQIVAADSNRGRWVSALTLGYTHTVIKLGGTEMGLGASSTVDFLPEEFTSTYGGYPWSGKIFVQLMGMGMWGWEH